MLRIRMFLLSMFLMGWAISHSQTIALTPKWKVGDVKKVTLDRHEKSMKDGELDEETNEVTAYQVKVLNETEKDFKLEILHENVALSNVVEMYEELDKELEAYKNLRLVYSVDKTTGKTDLLNWKEAKKFMKESIGLITNLVKDKDEDAADMMGLILEPVMSIFETKEGIEGYMSNEIEFLTLPFNKQFVVGDTLHVSETGENPFNPSDSLTIHTYFIVEKGGVKDGQFELHQTIKLDFTEFISMMKDMMRKMFADMEGEEVTEEKLKEIDNLEIDTENLTKIIYNMETSWPVSGETRARIFGGDGKTKNEKTVVATIKVE